MDIMYIIPDMLTHMALGFNSSNTSIIEHWLSIYPGILLSLKEVVGAGVYGELSDSLHV